MKKYLHDIVRKEYLSFVKILIITDVCIYLASRKFLCMPHSSFPHSFYPQRTWTLGLAWLASVVNCSWSCLTPQCPTVTGPAHKVSHVDVNSIRCHDNLPRADNFAPLSDVTGRGGPITMVFVLGLSEMSCQPRKCHKGQGLCHMMSTLGLIVYQI